ncbi:MAG: carbohydrate kinase family protein [bacterium]|nr:carbohydrate kinase family protein [bacterium]
MPSFDLVTIGAATQDVFVQSPLFEEKKDRHAPDNLDVCFPLGSKIELDDIVFTTGGGATNAAVTAARFGLKTACVCRIGDDQAGTAVVDALKQEKISTHAIQTDREKKTGYSVIVVAGSGHRTILTYRGAAGRINPTPIPWPKIKTSWLYLTSVHGDIELMRRIFVFAEKEKISVAWNPGQAELALGIKKLEPFLVRSSVVLVNREEAAALAELPPRHTEDILLHLGIFPQVALAMTDGQHGAYVRSSGKTFFAPPLKAKRINTTGAGDAFGSAFVSTLHQARDIKAALASGMLNATSVIQHFGAKAGILEKKPSAWNLKKVAIRTL